MDIRDTRGPRDCNGDQYLHTRLTKNASVMGKDDMILNLKVDKVTDDKL